MTWRDFTTFLYGCAVVVIDVLIFAPIYRYMHRRSPR